jgi:hypothetical protein
MKSARSHVIVVLNLRDPQSGRVFEKNEIFHGSGREKCSFHGFTGSICPFPRRRFQKPHAEIVRPSSSFVKFQRTVSEGILFKLQIDLLVEHAEDATYRMIRQARHISNDEALVG